MENERIFLARVCVVFSFYKRFFTTFDEPGARLFTRHVESWDFHILFQFLTFHRGNAATAPKGIPFSVGLYIIIGSAPTTEVTMYIEVQDCCRVRQLHLDKMDDGMQGSESPSSVPVLK